MKLKEWVSEKVGNSVLITGPARSGTTILGKVLHSMKNVEYSFEPPLLLSLVSQIKNIKEKEWRLLYETYLYEDFMLGALAGRNINNNRNDDSSIFNVKTKTEVDVRLSKSFRKTDLEQIAATHTIAYKIPSITYAVNDILSYYPNMRVVLIKRNPFDTISSILKKGWFSDNSLNHKNLIYPNTYYNGNFIPHWVSEDNFDRWINMSEIERCAYYYEVNCNIGEGKNVIQIKYEKLVKDPLGEISYLSHKFGLDFGELTQSVIASISKSTNSFNSNDISVSKNLNDRLMAAYEH